MTFVTLKSLSPGLMAYFYKQSFEIFVQFSFWNLGRFSSCENNWIEIDIEDLSFSSPANSWLFHSPFDILFLLCLVEVSDR